MTDFYFNVLSSLSFLILTGIFLFYMLNTDKFLKYGLKIYRSYAGMRIHFISRKNGQGVWCYAEKGGIYHKYDHHHHHHNHKHKCHLKKSNYPTLVFLHGFGADKDTWPSMVKYIPSKYHCIMVDMPGHGETTFVNGVDEPSVESYVKSLKEFLEITGLDQSKIYLIGCSFGGAVAAMFAYYHPDNVENLALLCPAIKTPILTSTCEKLMSGKFELLIPVNGEQFITMIGLLCHKTQYYPRRIMQSFVNLNFTPERQTLLQKILKNLVTEDLEKFDQNFIKIKEIKTKTLIIWGENDEMLHVSGAKLLNENMKNSQLKIIENCNHVLQLDQPKQATKLILDFINV